MTAYELRKEELHAMLAMYALAVTEHERRKRARKKARKRRKRRYKKRRRYSKEALQRIERAFRAPLSRGWHRRMPDDC